MVLRNRLVISTIVLIVLMALFSGCTGDKTNTDKTATSDPASTPKATVGAAPTTAPGTYKVSTEGKNVKITGNGVVKTDTFDLPENWYVMKLTYYGSAGRADCFDGSLMNTRGKTDMNYLWQKKGTYVLYDGVHYPETTVSEATDSFYLETREPTVGSWVVEYLAPPAAPETAPKTVTGKGSSAVGPIKVTSPTGKATITYNGPAEHFMVMFNVQDMSYEGYPSFLISAPDFNIDNRENGKYSTSMTKTVDLDLGEPGVMLLLEVTAPDDGSWSVSIDNA